MTHDKTNEILASKGIPPIAVNIRVCYCLKILDTLIFFCIIILSIN